MDLFLEMVKNLTLLLPDFLMFIVPIILIILLILVMQRVFNIRSSKADKIVYNYRAKQHIMTKREENFFRVLCNIFGDKCYIIPQVHLSALLEHRIKGQSWKGAFSHINGKSVDYVLLRQSDLSVLCVVELDDATHDTEARSNRDFEVERIFDGAKMPLVRLRSPEKMSNQEIVDVFTKVFRTNL